MMRGASPSGLERGLLALLPDAAIITCRRTAWHSATFSGERVVAQLELAGPGSASRADAFAAALPEAEFTLRKQFVADILVSDTQLSGETIRLTVDALLLDE